MRNIIEPIDLIGKTPLISFDKVNNSNSRIFAKAEFLNGGGAVKDRIALSMIETAEKEGILKAGGTIIEATSGNTGIGLAWIGLTKGYKVILTMPDSMSIERRKLLESYGVEIILTPASEGMNGSIMKSKEIAEKTKDSFLTKQFENPANPLAHYKTTGPEIWEQTEGKVDVFIAGVGTGGTITGVGKYLKEKNPDVKIIAVEPKESAVLSGEKKGPHTIQGIGAGFIPKVLNTNIYDEIIKVPSESARLMAKKIGNTEGLLVGFSSGANIFASIEYANRSDVENATIVTVLADTGERYLSTNLYN